MKLSNIQSYLEHPSPFHMFFICCRQEAPLTILVFLGISIIWQIICTGSDSPLSKDLELTIKKNIIICG